MEQLTNSTLGQIVIVITAITILFALPVALLNKGKTSQKEDLKQSGIDQFEQKQEATPSMIGEKTYNNTQSGFETFLYVISAVTFCISIIMIVSYLTSDLEDKAYVGGDAYNYIINATKMTSQNIITLVFATISGLSLIAGRLTRLINQKQNN